MRQHAQEVVGAEPVAPRLGRGRDRHATGRVPLEAPAPVDVAAGALRVVRVEAVRDVEDTAAERLREGPPGVRVDVQDRLDQRPRLREDTELPVGRGPLAVQLGRRARGLLQGVDVVLDGGDPVGLRRGLDDEPLGAGERRQLRAVPQQLQGAARGARKTPMYV